MTVATVQFTGYHGTTQSFAENIISEGTFKKSTKSNEWLGQGVYFFVDRDHAIWWAHNQGRRHNETNCAVLSATLTCKDSEFLDLDWVHNIRRVESCYKAAEEEGMFATGGAEFKTDEELQCFAINLFRMEHPEIKLVAYTFDSSLKSVIGFRIKQRQLCACDSSVIGDISMSTSMLTKKGGSYA